MVAQARSLGSSIAEENKTVPSHRFQGHGNHGIRPNQTVRSVGQQQIPSTKAHPKTLTINTSPYQQVRAPLSRQGQQNRSETLAPSLYPSSVIQKNAHGHAQYGQQSRVINGRTKWTKPSVIQPSTDLDLDIDVSPRNDKLSTTTNSPSQPNGMGSQTKFTQSKYGGAAHSRTTNIQKLPQVIQSKQQVPVHRNHLKSGTTSIVQQKSDTNTKQGNDAQKFTASSISNTLVPTSQTLGSETDGHEPDSPDSKQPGQATDHKSVSEVGINQTQGNASNLQEQNQAQGKKGLGKPNQQPQKQPWNSHGSMEKQGQQRRGRILQPQQQQQGIHGSRQRMPQNRGQERNITRGIQQKLQKQTYSQQKNVSVNRNAVEGQEEMTPEMLGIEKSDLAMSQSNTNDAIGSWWSRRKAKPAKSNAPPPKVSHQPQLLVPDGSRLPEYLFSAASQSLQRADQPIGRQAFWE